MCDGQLLAKNKMSILWRKYLPVKSGGLCLVYSDTFKPATRVCHWMIRLKIKIAFRVSCDDTAAVTNDMKKII